MASHLSSVRAAAAAGLMWYGLAGASLSAERGADTVIRAEDGQSAYVEVARLANLPDRERIPPLMIRTCHFEALSASWQLERSIDLHRIICSP